MRQRLDVVGQGLQRWLAPRDGSAARWYTSAEFRRHAGPDLMLALLCLALAFPPLVDGDYAAGLARAVAVQVLFVAFDLPLLYVLGFLHGFNAPRWLLAAGVIAVYAAAAAWIQWWVRERGGDDVASAWLFVLPLALRGWSLVQGLGDGHRLHAWVMFSICLIMPWMVCFAAVCLPLVWLFDLQRQMPGTEMVEILAPAWLAMGAAYFTLVGFARFVYVRLLDDSEATR